VKIYTTTTGVHRTGGGPQGNLIVYNAPGLTSAATEIRARGGAARQLISHAHEAIFGPQGVELGVFVGERDL
jgi:hypothetical protein